MKWIFECIDTYGLCIRQYIIFAFSLIIFFISLYSLFRILQKYKTKFQFEFIPLIINTLSTLGIAIMQSQQEQQSIVLLLLIIQIYSYSLLVYAYTKIYLGSVSKISQQAQNKFRISFIIFSLFMLALLITTAIILWTNQLTCRQGQLRIWYLGFTAVELPIFMAGFFFIFKTNRKIKTLQKKTATDADGEHLFLGEDAYIKIKYLQNNLTLAAFSLSILIHIVAISLLFVFSFSCNDKSYFIVTTMQELVTLFLIDIGDLLPHLLMPVVFYFVPTHFEGSGQSVIIEKIRISETLEGGAGVESTFEVEERFRNISKQHFKR